MAVVIAASAKGNYLYTTSSPTSGSDEDGGSKIGSDVEDEVCRSVRMINDADVCIYKLRVEPADREKNVYIQADFKDVSTQSWADLGPRESTYEIWDDDADRESRLHGRKTDAHKILTWIIETPDEMWLKDAGRKKW